MLDIKPIFNIRNNKKYKIKAICNSKVYAKEDIRQLLRLYYLIFWNIMSKKKAPGS